MINQLFSLVPIESLVKYTAEFLLEMVHHSAGRTWAARAFSPVATLPIDAAMSSPCNAPGASLLCRAGTSSSSSSSLSTCCLTPARASVMQSPRSRRAQTCSSSRISKARCGSLPACVGLLALLNDAYPPTPQVMLSLVVGVVTAIILLAVGLELWLIFGALAFWLNFVPTVGAVVAVFLPMPLVILDPDMSLVSMILAFVLPFTAHMVVGNVLEPLLFGHSLELQPVAILLSLTIWSMLWGLTGMILAVPITAVLKIHLDSIDHPASKFLVRLLVGGDGAADEGAMALQPTEDTIHSGAAGSSTLPLVERSLANPEEP